MTGFDAASLERQYGFLDACPEALVDAIVTVPLGTLRERVEGVLRWRDALLRGRLPEGGGWPPETVAAPILDALSALGLARFCKDQPELVDDLLKELLTAFARRTDELRSQTATRLRELEALERFKRVEAEKTAARKERRSPHRVTPDEETMERLRAMAERDAAQRPSATAEQLSASWGERVRIWADIEDVFGDLGQLLGRGWDLTRGVIRDTGWQDLLRLRELLKLLPQLREVVRSLGRLHDTMGDPTVAARVFEPIRRLEEERHKVVSPRIPAETRGIERSGELARMLPVEASMLGHPKLRLVWHARRAERALLTYRVEGVEVVRTYKEREAQQERDDKRPRPERGPVLVIVDTSGSMHGLPEQVAKALVLEALRIAHAEKRRCYLYAYSGPKQIAEQELSLSPEGVGRLLSFLRFSFGGGNAEAGVLARVVGRMGESAWKSADILFVSDGEWPEPTAILAEVQRLREEGTRFHGVQIGALGRTGLHSVCDPVHVFRDWAMAGGWR
jgi:uncharacterized protein with von Willebrand factor type A (vWA) domain